LPNAFKVIQTRSYAMNGVIYLIGLIVVVMAVLSLVGLR
jgi:hypothetical protein